MHLATTELFFMVAYKVDALQPTNLTLEGAHSSLMVQPRWWGFGQEAWTSLGDDKIIGGESPKGYKEQINARRREVEYEVGQKVVECEQLHLAQGPHSKVYVQKLELHFTFSKNWSVQGHV